jgi:Ca-activated chloride channel homolog
MIGSIPLTLAMSAGNLRVADPYWLLLWAAIPAAVALRARRRVTVFLVPFAAAWHRTSLAAASRWPAALALAGLALVVAALARPQRVEGRREIRSRGYDIMLAIDLSGSMLSEDYEKDGARLNRLQAIKPVIQAFIEKRPDDRIGVVLFSGHAYTLAPPTTDHDWLARQLGRVKIGLIEDGTSIGDAIGVALNRLEQARDASGRSRGAFIVLLTDGGNNMGTLAPLQAAAIARSRGVPIYTIGAGRDGLVPFPILDEKGNRVGTETILADLDEDMLRAIAKATGGKFFRAADTGTVESTFRSIDQSQKIEFQARTTVLATELFPWFAAPGVAFVVGGALLSRRTAAGFSSA